MVDSGPYPSDGENRAPRKHRYEKRTGHTGTRDGNPEIQNGYNNERSESRHQHEHGHNRHQDRENHREERPQSRHHEDRSRSRHQERDRHYEAREQTRNQRERSRDGYRERDKYHEDGEHNWNQSERSRNHYEERDSYNTEKSHYRERDDYHKERIRFDEKERRQEHYPRRVDRQGHPEKDPENDYPSERTFSPDDAQMNDMEYYEPEPDGGILDCHKCKYLCTGRACCQLVEVLLNMLILICCSVSYNSTGGYTGIASLGGIYYYQFGGAYSGFSGADGEKAQVLDVQFYQLKLPTVTASMAFGGALMAFSCLMVLLGVLRIPWRLPVWLLVECVLDFGIAVGYMPALYFYFHHLQAAYSSQVCKVREALYSSKGYQGFTCALHGADIAAALFACMAIIAFFMSAVLAIKGFRTVRRMKKKPVTTLEF